MKPITIALVGERDDDRVAHRGIPRALGLAGEAMAVDVMPTWVRSDVIRDTSCDLGEFAGIWCVPGSRYASMAGALSAIRHARERGVPFLGTCGGFQHALIEYVRGVLGIEEAEHAESSRDAPMAIIVPLECALLNVEARVQLWKGHGSPQRTARRRPTRNISAASGSMKRGVRGWQEGRSPSPRSTSAGASVARSSATTRSSSRLSSSPRRAALRGILPPLVAAFVRAALSFCERGPGQAKVIGGVPFP